MTRDEKGNVNLVRRALLRRIGLGAGMAYTAPSLIGFDIARASGSSSSGPSAPLESSSSERAPERRPAARQPQRPTRQQTQRAETVREIIAIIPLGVPLEGVVARGYRVLSQRTSTSLSAQVARFALPQGRSLNDGRTELSVLLPSVILDENHLYTPDAFLCEGGACAAHDMIGWNGWPSAMRPRIGMIDTGINLDHPALLGQRLHVRQIALSDRASAGRQHGTAIAAMFLGKVEGRVPGLVPDAELFAVEAFHSGAGGDQADAFSLVEAFDLLLAEGVDVINLSFSGPPNVVLERMVARAAEMEVGLVAAAGNGGPGAPPAYPAAWPQVIAVTAVDKNARPYRQANQGPYVMLAAPGVNIWTAASISGGRLRSGTSFAAPFVTASFAVARLRMPDLPLESVMKSLFACARDLGEAGFDPVFGHGLLTAPGQCSAENELFSVSGE